MSVDILHANCVSSALGKRSQCVWAIWLFFSLAGYGCQKLTTPPASKVPAAAVHQPTVPLTRVTEEQFRLSIEQPAYVEPYEIAELVPRVPGYVGQVLVDIGDEVQPGQILAELSVPELAAEKERNLQLVNKAKADVVSREAEVAQAHARLLEQETKQAIRQLNLTRKTNLVERGILAERLREEAQSEYDSFLASLVRFRADINLAKARVESAKAETAAAKARLAENQVWIDYTKIVAPFQGVITQRQIDPGDYVRPPTGEGTHPMFKIERIDKVRIVVYVTTDNADKVNDGDPVRLHSVAGLPQVEILGTVTRNSKTLDRQSRMLRAEIDLENQLLNPATGARQLKPGDTGLVSMTLESYDGLATVPASAVVTKDDGHYVVVVDEKNRCRIRPVVVEISDASRVGLSQGVQIGESVVAKNPADLEEGTKID